MSDSESTREVHPGPLEAVQRRVLGVLVEKAKTTPDAYPLSLNALRTGSNQKSNRFPQMDLDEQRVESAIDSLRGLGALTVVQGDSRVERYRHRLYEWLGVEKAELAVLAELLAAWRADGRRAAGPGGTDGADREPRGTDADRRPSDRKRLRRVPHAEGQGGGGLAHVLLDRANANASCATSARRRRGRAPPASPPPSQPTPTPSADLEQLRGEVAELKEEVARLRGLVEGA